MPTKAKTSWSLSKRIELNYARELEKMSKSIIKRLQGATSPDEIRRRLLVISNSRDFMTYCEALAETMAKQVYRGVNQNWRKMALEAAHKRGRVIFEALQKELATSPLGQTITDIVIQNATLIKTIPDKLAKEVATMMAKESAYGGVRSSVLAGEINARFQHLLPYQAKRIARTETSKAQMALMQARAQGLGLNWYVWRTAQDGERVRLSHRNMEGVLVNWNDPPDPEALIGDKNPPGPYNAGNIYNCRCYSEPVIDVDWIDFPCKIYFNGNIQTVTRTEFERLVAA